jgi:hypothetical protein
MARVLEIKVDIPLPDDAFASAKLQGKIAEFAEQFQASLGGAIETAAVKMRVYASKIRATNMEEKVRKPRRSKAVAATQSTETSQPERIVERVIPRTASGKPLEKPAEEMPDPPDFLKRTKPATEPATPPWVKDAV